MSPPEDAYGTRRRLQFVSETIAALLPARVLDLGCGSGAYLLAPLARRYPAVEFVGVDSDAASIAAARREAALPNVRLYLADEWPPGERFDLVIASEVIEHVESPPEFLRLAASRMTERARLVLTLPNGFGSYEWASLAEAILTMSGIFPVLRALKRSIFPRPAGESAPRDSYAVSPHINFFAYREILALIRDSGFRVLEYQPRSLLCGFGWDLLVRGERLPVWNQRAVDAVPPGFAADWMFLLEGGSARAPAAYRRGRYARFRRWVNEKRARSA